MIDIEEIEAGRLPVFHFRNRFWKNPDSFEIEGFLKMPEMVEGKFLPSYPPQYKLTINDELLSDTAVLGVVTNGRYYPEKVHLFFTEAE